MPLQQTEQDLVRREGSLGTRLSDPLAAPALSSLGASLPHQPWASGRQASQAAKISLFNIAVIHSTYHADKLRCE